MNGYYFPCFSAQFCNYYYYYYYYYYYIIAWVLYYIFLCKNISLNEYYLTKFSFYNNKIYIPLRRNVMTFVKKKSKSTAQTLGNPPLHVQEKRQERERERREREREELCTIVITVNYKNVMCWRRMETVRLIV